MEDKLQIKQFALEAGFDRVGVVSYEDPSEGSLKFKAWLEKNYHGEMTYLEQGAQKRADPKLILPHLKSLIVLALDYGKQTYDSRGSPFISRYAWGEDYHAILQRKLEGFKQKLVLALPHIQLKSYADTGPVLEKHWGRSAGLGWLGKHTNLIHPKEGSYFFLSCLLTNLDLKSDFPLSDHCGRCTACINICPTHALVNPYVLDARLCISYLTIELKGPIPRHLRPLMGTHVFGCDDCQEVCPWNQHARLPEEFLREVKTCELTQFLDMNSQAFKQRFKNSPILRTKRRGFLRNVCVVLGNLKDPPAIPALVRALHDEEELIRGHAAWALGQFDPKAYEALQARERMEEVEWVREEIRVALKDTLLSSNMF